MDETSRIQSAQPGSQAAVNHLNSGQSTSVPASDHVPDPQAGGKDNAEGGPVATGELCRWAIDVTVPPDWTSTQDRAHSLKVVGLETKEELVCRIRTRIDDINEVLVRGLDYLSDTAHYPEQSLFDSLPVNAKVAALQGLIRQPHEDCYYREPFGDHRRLAHHAPEVNSPGQAMACQKSGVGILCKVSSICLAWAIVVLGEGGIQRGERELPTEACGTSMSRI